jgi:integrase
MHDGQADYIRDDRYRALVLLAALGSLRWGEVTALHRQDLDLDNPPSALFRSLRDDPDDGTAGVLVPVG